jgi:hypothetical protein
VVRVRFLLLLPPRICMVVMVWASSSSSSSNGRVLAGIRGVSMARWEGGRLSLRCECDVDRFS